MLSKFSVRKPFTVLVAVVICLVLGFLSFQNMSTDFLPNMEFPYALVMTTYPGASPEEVEKAVSEPVEQAMEPYQQRQRTAIYFHPEYVNGCYVI